MQNSDSQKNNSSSNEAQEVKDFILQEMKRVGHKINVEDIKKKIPSHWGNVDRILDKLVQKGFLSTSQSPKGQSNGKMGPISQEVVERIQKGQSHSDLSSGDFWKEIFSGDNSLEAYKKKTFRKFNKESEQIKGSFSSFLIFAGGLFAINFLTGFGHPWFYYPVGFSAMHLANRWIQYHLLRQEVTLIADSNRISDDQMTQFKSFFKSAKAFWGHTVFSWGLSSYLVGIDLIVSPGLSFSLIVSAVLLMPWFAHFSKYKKVLRGIKGKLQELGTSLSVAKNREPSDSLGKMQFSAQAKVLQKQIISIIKKLNKNDPFVKDVKQLLSDYNKQITEMDRRKREIDEVILTFPLDNLRGDHAKLKSRLESAESSALKAEYQKSIDEVHRQLSAYDKLREQQEVVNLRVNSAVNALTQLKLDATRMKALSQPVGGASLDLLRDRSREMAEYLNDFQGGMDELN